MMKSDHTQPSGPIAWMAGNSVASNLLMLILVVGGVIIGSHVKQEVFPEFDSNTIRVTVPYPGASPEEVEKSVVLPIEEAVQGVDGIDEITSSASEGVGSVMLEALDGVDISRLWQDVQSEVNRITTFPDEIDRPEVVINSRKRHVLSLGLHGNASAMVLRQTAERVRDALLQHPDITQVDVQNVQDYEIAIEIPEANLRRYSLTLGDVALAIRKASVELGGGSLKTDGGEILIRVNDRRDMAFDYAQIPVTTGNYGERILLENIAHIEDGFEEVAAWTTFDGEPAIFLDVYRVGDQTPVEVVDAAMEVVARFNQEFSNASAMTPRGAVGLDAPPVEKDALQPHDNPSGTLSLSVRNNRADIFIQRADLLLKNAYMGLGLVFICLALFLELRLAFWVSLGIPISFLGAFLFLPMMNFSINMITMFAFIITLGIVVDDAIVVGENVYFKRKQGMPMLDAAILGAREIAMPVTFSVLTNIVAFLPLYFVPGVMGKVFSNIPVVVICVFFVSLIESLLVLPAHLGHGSQKPMWGPLGWLEKRQQRFSEGFERFVKNVYGPLLDLAIRFRYAVLALGVALLMGTGGYLASGRMGMVLFPKVESDYAFVEMTLPYGAAMDRVAQVQEKLVSTAREVIDENGGKALSQGIYAEVNENSIQVRVYLTPPKVRPISTSAFTKAWRQRVGAITGVESGTFLSDRGGPGSGKALTVLLSHTDNNTLEAAGEALAAELERFSEISDIDDGSAQGKPRYDIRLQPAGEQVGLTSRAVADQVRNAFQGVKAVTLLRGRNTVTVRVRLPRDEREKASTFENLLLRAPGAPGSVTPGGLEILLRDAASVTMSRAFTTIRRTDGRRGISVMADVTPPSMANQIVAELKREILPKLMEQFPGLSYSFEGRQADLRDSVTSLFTGLSLSLLAIYGLLAIPFRSYTQPIIILTCIPFGIIGAVWGHLLMGYHLSVMSLFGIVALTGVVVNDSMVMVDWANRKRRLGMEAFQAIHESGIHRFRPIMLTTLTTFGGLAPMILETSRQARFLIPMAISLGFGILFATFITLVLVPSFYMILEDIHGIFHPFQHHAISEADNF